MAKGSKKYSKTPIPSSQREGKKGRGLSRNELKQLEEYGHLDPTAGYDDGDLDEAVFKAINKRKYQMEYTEDAYGNEIRQETAQDLESSLQRPRARFGTKQQEEDVHDEAEVVVGEDSLLARHQKRVRKDRAGDVQIAHMKVKGKAGEDDGDELVEAALANAKRHGALFISAKTLKETKSTQRPARSLKSTLNSKSRRRNPLALLDSDSDDEAGSANAFQKLVGMLQKDSQHGQVYQRQAIEEAAQEDFVEYGDHAKDVNSGSDSESVNTGSNSDLSASEASSVSDSASSDDESEEDKRVSDKYIRKYAEDAATLDDRLALDLNDQVDEAEVDDVEDSDTELFTIDGQNYPDYYQQHFRDEVADTLSERVTRVLDKKHQVTSYSNKVLSQVRGYFYDDSAKDVFSEVEKPIPGHYDALHIKSQLQDPWSKIFQTNSDSTTHRLDDQLFRLLNHYQDILYVNRNHTNALRIRRAYVLHVLNHVLKARSKVVNHNTKLIQARNEGKDLGDLRDQGFTRPKVLIIVPFRNAALEVVNLLLRLSGTSQQAHKKRFVASYSIPSQEDVIDPNKPDDYTATFRGNTDDYFRMGIQVTRQSVQLFSSFYNSDIIVASPLGLRLALGAPGAKDSDNDYLSSIEMVIIDQCDAILMQNWDHLEHILKQLNAMPKEAHGCDFSRVKRWFLDGQAKYLRQTLVFSDYLTPELNSLFNNHCLNVAGKLRIKPTYDGAITGVITKVPQVFNRIECPSHTEAEDARFSHFTQVTLPALENSALMTTGHILIYIPSYFDYVRLRNFFHDQRYKFATICEYSSTQDVTRARTAFFQGQVDFLLYTERFHYFRRYRIRGIQHLIFYGLPDHAHYYPELINFMPLSMVVQTKSASRDSVVKQTRLALAAATKGLFDGEEWTCTVLFTKFDQLKLERVVGTSLSKKMVIGTKSMFTFT
ncbi:rRNA-binding ribosome biosynthesis protein utp25 [Dispira parvispora]|uniref:U3 small nucleolar RNA-associated protein 25 n=1 Tax=Dispira parvispora TaxID=1520584 RepID=A0A9W8E7L1_9FUNG|nr:rRNA-binding ribosome biosynthesis protein utp25 [Dispira parvispora]